MDGIYYPFLLVWIIGGGGVTPDGVNKIVIYFIFSFAIIAVNVFVLITGYFQSAGSKWTIWKPIELVLELVLIRVSVYVIYIFMGMDNFSVEKLLGKIVPSNYFTILFCTLYIISPGLNIIIQKSDYKTLCKYVAVMFILFSVCPTLWDQTVLYPEIRAMVAETGTIGRWGTGYGYSIINFVLMYFIGALLRKRKEEQLEVHSYTPLVASILYVINVIVLEIWTYKVISLGGSIIYTVYEYCNPLIVMNAVLAFVIFDHIKISYNGFVNKIARSSYTMFLVHPWILSKIIRSEWLVGSLFSMLMKWLCIGIVLIFVSFLVDVIWRMGVKGIWKLYNNRSSSS